MINNNDLNHDDFENLLLWLDADRAVAGQKYEAIRTKLIKIFLAQKCCEGEDLADETINRVMRKINQLINNYEGQPEKYFYAVAKNIIFECRRRKPMNELPANLAQPEETATDESPFRQNCFNLCLGKLSTDKKQFILEYYQGEKSIKLTRRRDLAEKHGISNHVLRNRALRLRENLQKCVLDCVAQNKSETF
ncbi:MAG: hypothetical protein WA584_21195 [Pyrinomonadaceae bacterium]